MKRILLLCCFAMATSIMNAQKIYFVYLQTENNEPFFVRMDDKLYSSSPSGYLILPRLLDSTYNFRLGFPGKDIDLDFSTTINKKDHGYLIKNFGEKGWGLFDLQSLSIQMSTSKIKGTAAANNDNTEVDAFTDLLARAAGDPSLKQNVVLVKEEDKKVAVVPAAQREEKKPEITEAVVKEEKKPEATSTADGKSNENRTADNLNDKKNEVAAAVTPEKKSGENEVTGSKLAEEKTSAIAAAIEKPADSVAKITVNTQEVYKKSLVTKIAGTAGKDGFESVFVDQYPNGNKDTIRILIPGENGPVIVKEELKPDTTNETKKFLDITSDTAQIINKPQAETKKEQLIKWWPFGKNKETETSKNKEVETGKSREAETSKPQAVTKGEESKKWNLFGKNKSAGDQAKKCESAGHDDFLKLRRKMAEKTNDDAMLDEAKRYFKEKCFSTEQIKNLSSMFLSTAGKYNFFEAAHNYVTDKENFPSLESELKDEDYKNRFKTLVGN